jgi:hypothetical protein
MKIQLFSGGNMLVTTPLAAIENQIKCRRIKRYMKTITTSRIHCQFLNGKYMMNTEK